LFETKTDFCRCSSSSSLLLTLPSPILSRIGSSHYSTVECDTIPSLPDFTFNFGGKPYTLTASEYIMQVGGSQCISPFFGLDIPAPLGKSSPIIRPKKSRINRLFRFFSFPLPLFRLFPFPYTLLRDQDQFG